MADQNDRLREALGNAVQQLREQGDMLETLTAAPYAYGVVVSVNERKLTPNDFPLRTRVYLPSGDIYGKVISTLDSEGDIQIQYDNGEVYHTKLINKRPPDAELIDNPAAQSPLDFTLNSKVLIRSGDYRGSTGTVIQTVDGDGDIRVRCSNGQECWVRVGKLINIRPVGWTGGTATIVHNGTMLEVNLPKGKEIRTGDTVKLSMKSLQIVDVARTESYGNISVVLRSHGDTCEVELDGGTRLVSSGRFNGSLQASDRVVLDATGSVVTRNLGNHQAQYLFSESTNVSWDDIGGLAEAKKLMREAIEMPHSHSGLYAYYKKKPIKGVLLYGPPGCGKTMLGKAAATALARVHNAGSSSRGFFYVKGPEILDKFVGVAEARIRQLFQQARTFKKQHGYPAVIFLDEADAILGKRGGGVSSDIERTIVPMFLAEMDGLDESGALVILTTNRPDILDPAIVRDQRIDRKIKVDRPNPNDAAEIFRMYLQGVPLNNGYTPGDLAQVGSSELFNPARTLYTIERQNGNQCLTLGHVCNGGMIAGIVDQTTSLAMARDIQQGGTPQGIRMDDLRAAVDLVYRQQFDINHDDDLSELVGNNRQGILNIRKHSVN